MVYPFFLSEIIAAKGVKRPYIFCIKWQFVVWHQPERVEFFELRFTAPNYLRSLRCSFRPAACALVSEHFLFINDNKNE